MNSSHRPTSAVRSVFVYVIFAGLAASRVFSGSAEPIVSDGQTMSIGSSSEFAGAPAANPGATAVAAWQTKIAQDVSAWQTRTTGEVNAAKTRIAAEQTRIAGDLKTKTAPIVDPKVAIEWYGRQVLGVNVSAANARKSTQADGDKFTKTDDQGRIFRAAWGGASVNHYADISSDGRSGAAALSYSWGGVTISNPNDWNVVLSMWSVGFYSLRMSPCPGNANAAFAGAKRIYTNADKLTWKPIPTKTGYAWGAAHADNGGNANQLKGGFAILYVNDCKATILLAMGGAGKLR